ncbi:MAG: hypothetical protein K2J87_07310 [Muribaculaceae bacterium]|nr:hypothetical protein [Muribaculaceae bacterium]
MKKVILSVAMLLSAFAWPMTMQARTSDEDKLVKELSGGLPVYMGGGLTWRTFDIDDKGNMVIGLLSNNLPEASAIDDATREAYKNALTGPASGYVSFSKKCGRNVIIQVYNTSNELCITEAIANGGATE